MAVGSDQTLYRAHQAKFGPVYYCTNALCRFDPPKSDRYDYGTCCTAYQAGVAVLEHLGEQGDLTLEWAAERRVSEITPRNTHKIADLLGRGAGEWRVGGDLSAGKDRPLTQSWGAAFQGVGFTGVRHKSAQDNALEEVCIAFYGPPGEHAHLLESGEPQPIDRRLLRSIERQFGIRAFPRSPLSKG